MARTRRQFSAEIKREAVLPAVPRPAVQDGLEVDQYMVRQSDGRTVRRSQGSQRARGTA